MGQDISFEFEYGIFHGPKVPGETPAVRHPFVGHNPLVPGPEPGLDTMIKIFQKSVERFPNRHMFASRRKLPESTKEKEIYGKYEYKTYSEVNDLVTKFAKGIVLLNLCPEIETKKNGKIKFLGIYSRNKEEWLISDMGSHLNSIAIVPIYDTLGDHTISYILSETKMTTIALESTCLIKLIKIAEDKKQYDLKNLILFDRECGEDLIIKAKNIGFEIFDFKEIIKRGGDTNEKIELKPAEAETLAVLSYTSGSTGLPKGTMLTHLQLVSEVTTLFVLNVRLDYNEVYMSYLPLAHVFERVINLMCIYIGATIAFYSGKVTRLMEDSQLANPTIFIAVPRVLDKIYATVYKKIQNSSPFIRRLFTRAYNDKLFYLRSTGVYTHPIWDRVVFKSIRRTLGNNLRAFVIGGAPVTPKLQESMKIFFSVPFVNGYGQTESSGAGLISHGEDTMPGIIGGCLASSEYKLIDVPELEYSVEDVNKETGLWEPRGEILLRGYSIFKSYFNNEELTKNILTPDGWLHTGDVGVILTGHGNVLKVIDRVKNIFKLSQGEYIAPEKIENEMIKCKYVVNIYVTGISTEQYIVAVIVPNKKEIEKFIRENNLIKEVEGEGDKNKNFNVEDYYENKLLKEEIIKELEIVGRSNGLKGFELIKKIYLSKEEFTIENMLITPTLKLRRNELKKKFSKIVENLYNNN